MSRLLVIPAAGRGSRLGGDVPKPLVEIGGRPLLDVLADLYAPFVDHVVVVANPLSLAPIRSWADARSASVCEQPAPTGMLDAILLALPIVAERRPDAVWITWADQVGVLPATLDRLAAAERAVPAPALIMPTVLRRDPYIHFPRDAAGRLTGLLQRREGDAMPREGEGDMGVFSLRREAFERDLPEYAQANDVGAVTGERNFLPFVPWLAQRRLVSTIPCTDPMEALGVNTRSDLQALEAWMRTRDRT